MNKKEIFNKVTTVLFVLFIFITIFLIIEPLLYNSNSKAKKINFKDKNIDIARKCFYTYIEDYLSNNIKAINKMYPITRRKSQNIYVKISEKFNIMLEKNIYNINIIKIESIGRTKYKIKYSLPDDLNEYILIISLNQNNKTFSVFYDSMIH